jgi:hypothetical protein
MALVISCKTSDRNKYREVKGEDYLIQVMPLQMNGDNAEATGYKVRILPQEKLLNNRSGQLKQSLWYGADSCFYLTTGKKDIQPELVQAVANGITNCFEYMVVFNSGGFEEGERMSLVFNDRHITHEKHFIELF